MMTRGLASSLRLSGIATREDLLHSSSRSPSTDNYGFLRFARKIHIIWVRVCRLLSSIIVTNSPLHSDDSITGAMSMFRLARTLRPIRPIQSVQKRFLSIHEYRGAQLLKEVSPSCSTAKVDHL